ncbi:hypothetical protein [Paenibacillus rigui]|uniref:Uncharacterized protein n=1 Tax=Paenibacillus rigui TaxID=554312 RepID=A0A229UNV8_9BACL|nr:hypothetical protein [Paenibacillus rigui]OXM85080.1 hypothetical protein CF651_15820 [Paenibacillus rigui]
MNRKVEQALESTLQQWQAMSKADGDDAESTADAFQTSFYRFIDALREWVNALPQRPESLEALLELPLIEGIVDQLPGPLYLNFETEAELILEHIIRTDDDKYD